MDTLDNAEALERQDAERNKGMVAGAARLVQAIRARFPDMAIMMNRGYALLPQVAGRIDIVLAEAMASRWNFAEGRYEMTSAEDWQWQANHLFAARSEERRVGKECVSTCRSRVSLYHKTTHSNTKSTQSHQEQQKQISQQNTSLTTHSHYIRINQ